MQPPLEIKRENAISAIVQACNALGWSICLPDASLLSMDDEVQGLIIGCDDYISYVVGCLPTPDSTKH